MSISYVLSTKITPPRRTKHTLVRTRVNDALSEALQFKLTLLQAGAGYGKSTALANFVEEYSSSIWYHVTEEDRDPFVFLYHLCHTTQLANPSLQGLPISILEAWDGTQDPLPALEVVFQYLIALSDSLTSPTFLVIDDIHIITDVSEIAHILDRLISLAPPDLHIVVASRPTFTLPNLSRWRSLGQVLAIDQSVLAFTPNEIAELFGKHYGYELSRKDIEDLSMMTEGWAITLQLIWQSLKSGAISSISDALNRQTTSLETLFKVLMQEVLGRQPQDVQEFMQISAILRVMDAQACNALQGENDSATMLSYLRHQELFVVNIGEEELRYHHIFRQFLQEQMEGEQRQTWHSRAAVFYQGKGDFDSAIYHLLQAKAFQEAASLLGVYGRILLTMGRIDTLASYLDALSPETLHHHPALLSYLGDLARLHSRFQEALGWYVEAETLWRDRGNLEGVGRALRGQARVYLDTVNPLRAEELLQQSLRLSDGTVDREAQARLYELLAENKLNAGKPEEAEYLQKQAVDLRREGPADSQLLIRVLLRTGRLDEARQKLEDLADAESREPVQTPRSHRETQLLLSIIYAMQGRPEDAYRSAIEGTRRGVELDSLFISAVGHMRQGHAILLKTENERYEKAQLQFEKAIDISRTLAVPRLRIEACWGLCQTLGRQGDLDEALSIAQEGIEIATQVGDEWIASLIRLAMGANYLLADDYELAVNWLDQAVRGFQECSDILGVTTARMWTCLGWFKQGLIERFSKSLSDVLTVCQQHGYDYIFTRPTLLGPFDERILVPMLIYARDQGWQGKYPSKLLQAIGLPEIIYHPGFQLRIETLGIFQVWQGEQLIPYNGWRRDKTRQLFQLLITNRHSPLDRDQFCEYLWPGAEPETAQRNFKVALSTLYNVLEPDRVPGSESAYIIREGTIYRIRPNADIWLDADNFIEVADESRDLLEKDPDLAGITMCQALDLYQGEYLPDTRYETWAAMEREHLAVLFLQTADSACDIYLKRESFDDVIGLCQRILAQDNCWERAYRYLMMAYHGLGDHGQIARTYQQCIETLRKELDVAPAPETTSLLKQLTS